MREGRDGRNLNRYGISVFTIDEASNSRWTDHKVPLGKIPSGNTQSKEAMATAKLWLKDCQDNHTTCGPGILVPPPTRLLEITTQAEPEASFKVRLVELGDTRCRIKTTLETLEARKTDIPWADLCRTFKDAITTAHELDLSYIWIDSLCIIQNSKEDWQNEAANMAAIYEGALITIAATRSSNHDGGCFSEMSQAFRTHKVSLSSSSGEQDAADEKPPLYFRQMIPHCLTTIHSTEQAEEFPLLTRGWVYQERLLSPRMLHFNNHELSWECNTLTTCECANPDGHTSSGLRPPYLNEPALPKLEHTDAIFGRGLSGHSLALTSRWHNIVTEFTGLGLTVEGDALPALAGVASQISRLRRDAAARSRDGAGAAEEQQNLEAWEERQQDNTYFAGLWTGSLFYDLLWTAESDAAPRPSAYRGPSWSWMATRSPVNYDTADVPAMVEFYPRFWGMGGVATIAGTDPFGAVEPPTSLLLEGRMLDAKVRYKEDQQKQQQQQQQLPQGETGGVAAKATTGPAAGTRPQMVQRWAAAQKASDYDIELADGSGLGTHASFHADYGLRWDEGYDYVPDGFPVQLMLVAKSDNYFFYLVLVRVRLFVPDPQQDVQDTMDGSDASGAGEGRQNTGFTGMHDNALATRLKKLPQESQRFGRG
ncbi:putative het domain-containing protein [Diaporthe ampelina]|uniref:Putative het domain-containing protein n=1 Tax=Diaporthe ampelina TaxID=1214573 RepID=A0A0G2G0J7_9PEZI|nr:putative het domain-containing protein [Diaporthe ampelina]